MRLTFEKAVVRITIPPNTRTLFIVANSKLCLLYDEATTWGQQPVVIAQPITEKSSDAPVILFGLAPSPRPIAQTPNTKPPSSSRPVAQPLNTTKPTSISSSDSPPTVNGLRSAALGGIVGVLATICTALLRGIALFTKQPVPSSTGSGIAAPKHDAASIYPLSRISTINNTKKTFISQR